MSFQILATIASAGLSIVGALDTSSFRSRVLAEFSEIRTYLFEIDTKLNNLIELNSRVLSAVNALPEAIYRITDEVISQKFIDERYNRIDASRAFYRSLDEEEEWELFNEGFKSFRDDLYFLFTKEGRLSNVPKLISAAEFGIVLYKGPMANFVSVLVDEKIDRIRTLYDQYESEISVNLATLYALMNNKTYVESTNFTLSLEDFSSLEFSMREHRTRTEQYVDRVCEQYEDECCRTQTRCRDVKRTRTVADSAFNSALSGHEAKIRNAIAILGPELEKLATLQQVVAQFDHYQASLDAELPEENNFPDTIKLVDKGAEELVGTLNIDMLPMPLISPLRGCY